MLKLRLATNEVYYDKEKRLVERTEWHSVALFGPRAEALAKILSKGDTVLVEGSLRTSSYDKDGVTRYRTEVVARDLCLGGRRRAASSVEPAQTIEVMEEPYADTAPGDFAPSSRSNGASNGATAAL